MIPITTPHQGVLLIPPMSQSSSATSAVKVVSNFGDVWRFWQLPRPFSRLARLHHSAIPPSRRAIPNSEVARW